MGKARIPLDVRGPVGLLGVGLIAGAAGIAVVGMQGNGDVPPAQEEQRQLAGLPDLPSPDDIRSPPEGGGPADRDVSGLPAPLDPPPGRPSPVMDPEPAPLPPEEPEEAETPSPVPQVSIQQAGPNGTQTARAGMAEVVFIVRLKGAAEVDTITRNFKRDPAVTQAAWLELTQRVPLLAEFELVGASYAGEMRLSRRMKDATPEAISKVQSQLLEIDGVAYADPDYVAHPGKGETP